MDVAGSYIADSKESIVKYQQLFLYFLEEFCEGNVIKYKEYTKKLLQLGMSTLEISFDDIKKYNQELATAIILKYNLLHPFFNQAISDYISSMNNSVEIKHKINKEYQVSFVDVPKRYKIRQLDDTHVGILIRISGKVVWEGPIRTVILLAAFDCEFCKTQNIVREYLIRKHSPNICCNPYCKNRLLFSLNVKESITADLQTFYLQEELSYKYTPKPLEIICIKEKTGSIKRGDCYDFTGSLVNILYEVAPSQRNHEGPANYYETYYKTVFLASNVQETSTIMTTRSVNTAHVHIFRNFMKLVTYLELDKMKEMKRDPNVYNNLVASLFPGLRVNPEVKKAILLMLVGGTEGVLKGSYQRGDINVILVDSPNTIKSQLLKEVSEMFPAAIYTTGKMTPDSSNPALFEDEESFYKTFQTDALTLAENSVCCIADLENMELDRQIAMFQAIKERVIDRGVMIAKNKCTAVLASATPLYGEYNYLGRPQDNLDMSVLVLTCFDLILTDIDNNLYEVFNECVYGRNEIVRYILYVKSLRPVISKAANDLIFSLWKLRVVYGPYGFTGQWLATAVRLSEAVAKIYCSKRVTEAHVIEAVRLLQCSHSLV